MAYKDLDKKREYHKKWYHENKDRLRELQIQNRARTNELSRQRRQEQGDEERAYEAEWRAKNSLHVRIIRALGEKCVRCGFDNILALQIDHVNGGGTQHRKSFANNTAYLKYVLEHADSGEYQILCSNCNWIKRHMNNEMFWIAQREEKRKNGEWH